MLSGEQEAKLEQILSGGHASSSSGPVSLPQPVSPAWFDAGAKAWYGEADMVGLSKKEKLGLIPCSLFVQYSPTNRAGCRRCGEKIEKDALRLGYPFRYRANEDANTVYLHPECYASEVFGIKEKELRTKVFGYEALNNTERARLWKAMRSNTRATAANKEGSNAAEQLSAGSVGVAPVPPVPVPKNITQPMLPYQKEGLSWMCNQEETEVKGGVLADEMGMGKTLQAISLLVARPLQGPCLVVCPMAAVRQWVTEIEKFTRQGTMNVVVYHGASKAWAAAAFQKCDVVVTTYQTLESEYRSETNKQRVACKWCKKLFMPEKLIFHQKYFCGPDAVRTAKQQKTDKKFQDAAKKAMTNMGIGSDAPTSSVYAPPTITNMYREYMREAGVDVKAKGYFNVMKENAERMKDKGTSSSSTASSSQTGEQLNRERLVLLDREELKSTCQKRGLDTTGKKSDLIDRIMDSVVKGMGVCGGSSAGKVPAKIDASKAPARSDVALAKAKAKGKAKAQAKASSASLRPRMRFALSTKQGGSSKYLGVSLEKKSGRWVASYRGTYLGIFATEIAAARKVREAMEMEAAGNSFSGGSSSSKSKGKPVAAAQVPNGGGARTVASVKAAAAACGSGPGPKVAKGKATAKAKGMKRKASEMEADDDVPAVPAYKTYEGVQIDLSGSTLHSVTWSRIILDEAHRIKGRTNSTAMAAYALQTSGAKWCLTGTPLQNRVGELYSLIRFLRMRPFAFYYCKKKGCMCECSKFMRDRYCPNCGHVRFMHYSCFKNKVSNPIIKFGYMGAGKSAFNTLRDDILNKVMLRRTKQERKADLQLPDIKVMVRKDTLSKQEQDFYTSLYKQSCVKFDTYVSGGTILHNYAHIFDLLTSLRRAVDHPYLIVYGGGQATHKLPDSKLLPTKARNDVCGLCQEDVLPDNDDEPRREAKCGHVFHDECIRAYIADAPLMKSGGVGCPVCFTKLQVDLADERESDDEAGGKTPSKKKSPAKVVQLFDGVEDALETPPKVPKGRKPGIMQKIKASEFQSSTKIEALVDEVKKMQKRDPTAKGIVFSQFGVMLELVEFRLKRDGISCVVFRGGMSMQARNDALIAFNSDPTLKIILISLKAGGEGLNLQIANHVFLLDPWWNPACELQAIQRAHRIGQTKEVRAVRLICADTIEEKILKLQEKKQLVFDAAIDASSASLAKLTEQDLRFLFQQ